MVKKLIVFSIASLLSLKGMTNELEGKATYYHNMFVGRKTANGEIYSQNKLTAASNNFKLGVTVRVTNLVNGLFVDVRINDRMALKSQKKGRIVDLSTKAFQMIDNKNKSILNVKVEII